MTLCGVLLIDKPEGIRSTACVASVRRRLGKGIKVGHGGTLDSTAGGLLVLLVGGATRTSSLVMGLPKVYDVRFRLGEERTTDDFSGDTVFLGPVPPDAGDRLTALLPSFLGTRLQTPPDISAVRVNGERAHRIARSGESPAISSRPVHISSIRLTGEDGDGRTFALRIRCRKGTYVRSIVRDIGRALECGAYVLSLTRRSIGRFRQEDALTFGRLESGETDFPRDIRSLSELAVQYYSFSCDSGTDIALLAGKTVPLSCLVPLSPGDGDPGGKAIVLGERVFSWGTLLPGGLYEPKMNIPLEGNR
ncbi:tRNA pseudouridine(55) synthase TruB [Aminivibrio sp.]|jgi:tRNA pseudouridine(55) synthase|uniref:tRNA pseudouridine(55) synthase TruB n=1 Tax=Aminivibrio sp. TaxID=1872489 RepID=UPI001A4ED7CF|nr:tRNA pseudouridine(55) synthase TruB [Aminivibrio sp.]MBL3539246.1 tRNA pseudouridine(55) synthase TruB [Aminivibrio sp.]